MESIVNFFQGIAGAITALFDFVISFFRDFADFLKLISFIPSMLAGCLKWIPSNILSMVLLILTVVVMYKILGREG